MTQNTPLQVQVDESQPIRVDSKEITLIIRNNSSSLYSNVNIEFEYRRDIRLYPSKIHLARLTQGPAGVEEQGGPFCQDTKDALFKIHWLPSG